MMRVAASLEGGGSCTSLPWPAADCSALGCHEDCDGVDCDLGRGGVIIVKWLLSSLSRFILGHPLAVPGQA